MILSCRRSGLFVEPFRMRKRREEICKGKDSCSTVVLLGEKWTDALVMVSR